MCVVRVKVLIIFMPLALCFWPSICVCMYAFTFM